MTRATPAPPAPEGHAASTTESLTAPNSRAIRGLIIGLLCAALLVAGVLSYLVVRHRDQLAALSRPTGIPASVSTPLADLMQLSMVPTKPAPGFTLTDQNGRVLSLRSFRGHPVVLEFMDPHCVDVCPIVSQEFIDARRDLGAAAQRTMFIAVNVNPYYTSVSDMAAYSAEHQLTTIPTWHFFTGPVTSLQAVWQAYSISVSAPSRSADVLHTSEVLFIDPNGRERYIAVPMTDYTASHKAYLPAGLLAQWGQGIALVSRALSG